MSATKKKPKPLSSIARGRALRVPMTDTELAEAHAVALEARIPITVWIRSAIRAEFLRLTTTATTKKKRTPR
ncbi:MAG TPA: hypothetical protein VF316_25305 [Polyangiaceae bacterium]